MSEDKELLEDEIVKLLNILGDNTDQKIAMSDLSNKMIADSTFEIHNPDNASLHYKTYFYKYVKALEDVYAERLIGEMDFVELSDHNYWLLKKLFTKWDEVERKIANFIIKLNDTSMLSTDYARDVVRNFYAEIECNIDFKELIGGSVEIGEYDEERKWFQPPFGTKKDWVLLTYAIMLDDIMMITTYSANIIKSCVE